jgi:two-component system NarL family response regulator
MRDGVAALLNAEPEIEVVGTASDGLEAVDKAVRLEVGAVVMDIKMPELDGIKAAHRIKARRPETGIVILSNYADSSYVHELLVDRQPGYAYLLKTATLDKIKSTILAVAGEGLIVVDPQVAVPPNPSSELDSLTAREKEVLSAIAQGLDNNGIADELHMQPSTVSMHLTSIYSKLGVDGVPGSNPRVVAVLVYYGLLE